MVDETPDHLAGSKVGIIGCGHLGTTFAECIIDCGFPRDCLMVSHGSTASTQEAIRSAGLEESISENQDICLRSKITFISVRPQSFKTLKGLSFADQSIVVSCMAGVSRASLKETLGVDAHRIMPSGPDTIRDRRGIVAVYPRSDILASLLSSMGMKVFELTDEEMMHHFTIGVCLPAALIAAGIMGLDVGPAIDAIEEEYPDIREIYHWARDVLPAFDSEQEMEEYISRMCTKGGITEAIVGSICSGSSFLEALRTGIARSREFSSRL